MARLSVNEFAAKFKAKRECYNFLAVDCEVYLPPYDNTTIYFVSFQRASVLIHLFYS